MCVWPSDWYLLELLMIHNNTWNHLTVCKGWSCGLVHCPAGNATDLIWRVLASSDRISSWTPLKPQHSNPNPNPLANQLWCIDLLTPLTPLITPHRLRAFLESLMPLKNWCSIYARCSKSSLKPSIRFCGIFPSFKQNFIAKRSTKVSDCIFEIHQQWQSGFSRLYSNCCCSCSFELVRHPIRYIAITYWIFKVLRQFQRPIRNRIFIVCTSYIYIYIYIYINVEGVLRICLYEIKSANRVQFLVEVIWVSLSASDHGKGMNPFYPLPSDS